MRSIPFLLLLIGYFSPPLIAQQSPYRVWINYMNDQKNTQGYLYKLDDRSILLADKLKSTKASLLEVNIGNIQKLMVRKKGSVIKGGFLGAVLGMTTGVMLGFLAGDKECGKNSGYICLEYSKEERAIIFGSILTFAGLSLGAAIASKGISIPLYGQQEMYEKEKSQLTKYLIQF